jgi:hypothetical protein
MMEVKNGLAKESKAKLLVKASFPVESSISPVQPFAQCRALIYYFGPVN